MPVELKRPCPVCQSQTGNFLYHQDFILFDGHPLSQGFDLVYCDNCYFTFADTTVTQADYDEYYTNLSRYQDNKTSTGGGESNYDSIRLDNAVNDIVQVVPNKEARILDIGCANGGLLKRLKDIGYKNLVGLDPSPVCVANTKSLTCLEAYASSLYHIPVELGKFDLIIVSHVLEHLFEVGEAVSAFADILNANGILYAECPDAAKYDQQVHAPFQEFNTEHINHFSLISFQNIFSLAGFEKVKDGQRFVLNPSGLPYAVVYGFYARKEALETPSTLAKDQEALESIKNYIQLSSNILSCMENKISLLNQEQQEILVWGTGQLTMKLLVNTSLKKSKIKGFIDSSPVNEGRQLLNIPIHHPSNMADKISHKDIILVTSTIYEDAIKEDIVTLYKFTNRIEGLKSCLN
ncbi:methyltransferase type 11 [Adhaeribacter arboris]|uniref:Methyltransferase type 11 n=1 Tax=Adhaeribacter arboris TaxID=2072846 RepID=A0A2T2YAB3_9BACT|nr:class I SAM-dependent methyltransferase [Adhaeribacter arboris]PSR52470.1 methyltransferase type 11 [Adhaeribacter arboris]